MTRQTTETIIQTTRRRWPVGLALVVAIAGCSEGGETDPRVAQALSGKTGDGDKNGKTAEAEPPESIADARAAAEMGKKLEGYVKCINRHSSRMSYAREQYFKMFKNDEAGPKGCKVRGTPGSTFDPKDCVDAIEESAGYSPKLPELEAAGKKFAAALVALHAPNAKVYKYYDQKDHKDDNCALGIEMHPSLLSAWKSYGEAERELRVQLDAITDKREKKELARLADKYGKDDLRYQQRKVMIDSLALLRLLEVEVEKKSPDEAAIKTKTTALADAIDKLSAQVDADKKAADEVVDGIASFANTALDYRKKTKEFMRATKTRKRKKLLFAKHHGIVAEYNDLVNDSNRLKFAAP